MNNIFNFSLGKRLTLYFIIFGLILGYIVFMFGSMYASHQAINFMSNLIAKKELKNIYDDKTSDIILKVLNNNDKKLMTQINYILNISVDYKDIVNSNLYYYDNFNYKWKEIIYNKETKKFVSEDLDENNQIILNHHLKKNIKLRKNLKSMLFNKSEYFYIDLTRNIDKSKYLLRLEGIKGEIKNVIKENSSELVVFIIMLVVLSAFLSKFFTRKITKPIKQMSKGAIQIAEGNYNYRLKIPSYDEIGILADSMNKMAGKVQANINEIQNHLNTMGKMNQIDKAVLSSISRKDLLQRVVGIVASLFIDVNIVMLLRNEKKQAYDILSFNTENSFTLLNEDPCVCDTDIYNEYFKKMDSVFQLSDKKNDKVYDYINHLAKEHLNLDKTGSILNIPMTMQEKNIGVILMLKKDSKGFDSREIEAAKMLSDQVCVAFQSVKIFEEKESLLFGILLALTKSIDAKSKWTAGHSERVAKYAEELAVKIGFKENNLEQLTISAVLHDIGKIAVPETILDKPAKLTVEEFDIIKQHPSVGAKIISDIPSYDAILPGILYHHEHWDGSGYPEGLKADKIPLNSRIIAIADVFDAITEERPYRKGMKAEEAINFMNDQKKKLFDAELTEIFIGKVAQNITALKKIN